MPEQVKYDHFGLKIQYLTDCSLVLSRVDWALAESELCGWGIGGTINKPPPLGPGKLINS